MLELYVCKFIVNNMFTLILQMVIPHKLKYKACYILLPTTTDFIFENNLRLP